jgi:DNA-binding transcriptional MerR regulator
MPHPAPREAVGSARRAAKTLNIGEVLDRLRSDYPDATLSKIRYLEAEGLVEPARTTANYRKYSLDDVARLRYVLAAQRERFLPLRVIKEELAALDAGRVPRTRPGPRSLPPEAPPTGLDVLLGSEQARLSRRELLAASGLDEAALTELEQFGLLAPPPGGTYYDADALVVAQTFKALTAYGVQARHLRGARAAADREAGLIEQVVAPMRADRDGGAGARRTGSVDELAALFVRLHAALLRAGLRAGAAS